MTKNRRPRKVDTGPSKPLRHPPLSEVVFEINFPRLFAVENRIADYQQRLLEMYPDSGDEFVLHLPPAVAFGKGPKPEGNVTPVRSFVFKNKANSRVVRVSVVYFNLLISDYLHFDDYKRALMAALNPAIEIFQLSRVERIGLRYINKIPIPKRDAARAYREYVRSPIDTKLFTPHQINSFLTEISIDLAKNKKLTIRSGLLPIVSDSDSQTYLVDLDCSSPESVILSAPGIVSLLDEYHESIESEFKRAMTDKYWNHMAEGMPM
jgi:uncharacterized protein (TIGR04255 family)